MRRFRRTSAALSLAALAALSPTFAPPAFAQYMYLDSNGDGVHTSADVVNASGATTVDVWIRTNANRDGTPAVCSSGNEPLDIGSYQFILHASEGTVAWGSYVNAQPQGFPSNLGSEFDTSDAFVFFGGFTGLPPGTYKLGTIDLTVVSGTPSLTIAPISHLSDGYLTAFGSTCSGNDFDGFLKLGPNVIGPGDWLDVDGLAYGGTAQHAPVLAPIPDTTLGEGEVVDAALSATDVDGDPVTFSKRTGPAFMQVSTTDAGSGAATGVVHLSPGYTDAGTSTAIVDATDGGRVAEVSFTITVREVDRPPVLAQPRDMVVEETSYAIQDLVATDPDGQLVSLSKVSGPAYAEVVTGVGAGPFILVAPGEGFGGRSDSVTVAASDGRLLDQKSFRVTVKRLPALAQPSDMVVRVNTTADQVLSATDGDGDPLALSKVSGPYFVRISTTDPGSGSASGLVHVTPGDFDAGSFEVTVLVQDDMGSVQTTFRVTVVDPIGGGLGARDLFAAPFLSFDAGNAPFAAALGDLNRDGKPDLVVADQDFSFGMSVLIGTGGGNFANRAPLSVGGVPRSFQLADLDGDGIPDLAVAVTDLGVAILLGRGDGTFLPHVDYSVGGGCAGVAVGDVNGDGYPDIAGTSISGRIVRVRLNRGDGTFGAAYDLPTGAYPITLRLEDLDHDGALDLVVADFQDAKVEIFRGHGDGTFEPVTSLVTEDHPSSIAIGDLNADGYKDIVVPNLGLGTVSIFFGGAAGIGVSRQDFTSGAGPATIAIDDFNHDGRPDLVVANSSLDSVSIFLGDVAGGFVLG